MFFLSFFSIHLSNGVNSQLPDKIDLKITSHKPGNYIPPGSFTINGISEDTSNTDCQVFVETNAATDNNGLMQATPTGIGGIDDYSNWTFTYPLDYDISQHGNELSSEIVCDSNSVNLNSHYILKVNSDNEINIPNSILPTSEQQFVESTFTDTGFIDTENNGQFSDPGSFPDSPESSSSPSSQPRSNDPSSANNNKPPVAYPDEFVVNPDQPIEFSLSAYDPDPQDNANLIFLLEKPQSNGLMDFSESGNVRYKPNPGTLTDHFSFKVSDGKDESNEAVIDLRVSQNTPPTALIEVNGDSTIEQGESITLDGSSSDDDNKDSLSFRWGSSPSSVIDGSTSPITTFTSDESGSFTITLTVTDNEGLEDSDEKTINVVEPDSETTTDEEETPDEEDTARGEVDEGSKSEDFGPDFDEGFRLDFNGNGDEGGDEGGE